ncbi:nuclear transport factor 2 family protein [Sphingomonas colocasiae]|uniref:Nuclear transport factor 2 family protein n=1 Tax=Sphingomonas colocasiae TaxID=1848973 RepID=A0ABS7PYL7_9SPHN|nr:nuclear transport factor 2 family protein [Sphingomonas colocasiae]MBY8826201.1 nuclear transport factor 2 family protein [Sphingomonas colocasiae]
MGTTQPRQGVIRDYYAHIDRVDLDWVLALFAADAVYERADATYSGISEISHFFREERQIRGVHDIEQLWADDDSVVALGEFRGVGAEGDARRVRFTDVWHFGADERVRRRQTFLALGHGYVAR